MARIEMIPPPPKVPSSVTIPKMVCSASGTWIALTEEASKLNKQEAITIAPPRSKHVDYLDTVEKV